MKHYPTNAHYQRHLFKHSCFELVGVIALMALLIASSHYGWLDPFARLLGFDQ